MSTLNPALERRREVARRVNDVLGEHPEVTSVYVFGSVASGHVDDRSDVDITFVCRSDILPLSARQNILSQIGSKWRFDDTSQKNPIWDAYDTDGIVDDIPVDAHYQTVSSVSQVLDEVVNKGTIATEKIPFRPYTLAALVQRAWLLRDKDGVFRGWLKQTKVYPQRLKTNILRHFAPMLRENSRELKSHAERRLGPIDQLLFLTRAVDALTSLLFALNETYDPADRRAELTVLPTLTYVPRDFVQRLRDVVEGPFDTSGALERAQLFEELATEVLEMTDAAKG